MSVFAGNMTILPGHVLCAGCRVTMTNGRITIVHTYSNGCSRRL